MLCEGRVCRALRVFWVASLDLCMCTAARAPPLVEVTSDYLYASCLLEWSGRKGSRAGNQPDGGVWWGRQKSSGESGRAET